MDTVQLLQLLPARMGRTEASIMIVSDDSHLGGASALSTLQERSRGFAFAIARGVTLKSMSSSWVSVLRSLKDGMRLLCLAKLRPDSISYSGGRSLGGKRWIQRWIRLIGLEPSWGNGWMDL